jgi:hypothetical protein
VASSKHAGTTAKPFCSTSDFNVLAVLASIFTLPNPQEKHYAWALQVAKPEESIQMDGFAVNQDSNQQVEEVS